MKSFKEETNYTLQSGFGISPEEEAQIMKEFEEFLEERQKAEENSQKSSSIDKPPPFPTEDSGLYETAPKDGDFKSKHKGHKIITNQAAGKKFYMCKDCGVEVVDDPVIESKDKEEKAEPDFGPFFF